VDADLAALLDSEVAAAEGGAAPAAATRVPEPAAAARPAGVPRESIDVPPAAAEAQPVAPAEAAPGTVAEPGHLLPVTRRFGAIIMDTAPAEPTPAPAGKPAASAAEELLPELSGTKALAPTVAAVAPAGPGAAPEERPLPAPPERTDEQKTIIISRLSADWQKALHRQIDELYKQVATEFSSPPALAEKALDMLREARALLIETPEEYVTAEYRTLQVKAMLDRTQESRKQSRILSPRILLYEIGWIVLFLLGLIFATPFALALGRLVNIANATINDVFPFWNTMMWGGIGGVIGALYHLWWHVSDKQDFDREYLMWYLIQPIMGLGLGGIVFLLMAGGLLMLQVNLTDNNASTAARLLPYLLAVLGGFRQNFVYEQFDRLVALFTPSSQRGEGESGEGRGA
jgi:hypothetical protein